MAKPAFRTRSTRHSGVGKTIVALFILALVGTGGYFAYARFSYANLLTIPASQDTTLSEKITIPSGSTLTEVAALLETRGVVSHATTFSRYVRSQGWETDIRAGEYILKPNTLIPDIAARLSGKANSVTRLTIPEGYTSRQINQLLLEKGLVQENEFLECLKTCSITSPLLPTIPNRNFEGFLFPETYLVDPEGFDVAAFVNTLINQTSEILSPYHEKLAAQQRTLYQVMIMASMIEKETVTDEERPIVAGILWKRLDAGWFLGVDATTRYSTNDWQNPITAEQLKEDNPYNTRKNKGLPPTPICNPGEKSIVAAISPQESPYWYYLHDRQGNVRYARTQEEHDRNRAKYLGNL